VRKKTGNDSDDDGDRPSIKASQHYPRAELEVSKNAVSKKLHSL